MHVAGSVSEGNPRKKEWHAFGGAAVRCARGEEKQVISDMLVGVPRSPMSSQGEGQEGGRTDTVHIRCGVWCQRMQLPLRRVQRPQCVQQSVTCIFVSAERLGAARRCRRTLIIGPFSLSARREKQLFLQAMCCSASVLPTGCHAAVSLQCNSRVPHCKRGPL
ncbi:hypothetical protein TcCL_NonESM04376 [Trypanosoma cruzi]|nr:hypothetical protein TcCL_NonESM04376 [Trypanosoma cruzi]